MTEYNKCTCVKVNQEKMDLIKAKGLKLQDILDKAMDYELNINKNEIKNKEIEQLNTKIQQLEQEKEKAMNDCQKKIDILLKNLIESKKHEEEFYNKKINYLKLKKQYLEENQN